MPISTKSKTLLQNLVQKIQYENKRSISFIQTSGCASKISTSRLGLSLAFINNKQRLNCIFLSQYTNKRNFSVASALNMRFVQFTGSKGGPQRLGVQLAEDGDIFDISGVDSSIPNTLVRFLKSGDDMMEKTKRIVAEGKSVFTLSDVQLLPPLTSPDKIVCVGLNYKGHCDEQNIPYPKEPVFFSKWSSCIVGPNASVKLPSITNEFDWEVELAVIIGKQGKDIRQKDAMNHVFGYSVGQDLTARDWQKKRNGGQWLLGKSMDGACPLGPAVAIKEVVPDPHTLPIRCKVNGEVKQEANTNELIQRIDFIISYLSRCCTLLPGDVILTGTPSGVGVFRNPQEFLKDGSFRRADIVILNRQQQRALILDPTIRFETDEQQSSQVNEEKKAIYNPCIPHFSERYKIPINAWEVTGLLFGARGISFKLTRNFLTSLKSGDVIESEIEGVGKLKTVIV